MDAAVASIRFEGSPLQRAAPPHGGTSCARWSFSARPARSSFFCACQSGSGPGGALDLQPGVGGGARVFAGPEDGVGCAAQVNLGKYGFRTGGG
jgi:hypothetical protein